MPTEAPAAKFIAEAVNHPEWLKIIEAGPGDAVVALAKEHGFDCSLEDLKQASRELLPAAQQSGEAAVDEAAAGMSDFESDTGYGNDTGYAVLYGIAGTILKM